MYMCMYVRRSLLRSCYSQPLLSYVPPRAITDTCERCLHTATATRQRPHGGQSFRVALNAWAHTWRAPTARPIKAHYLNIVTIRPLYTYPMPLMSGVILGHFTGKYFLHLETVATGLK